jgi:hypothetical protein
MLLVKINSTVILIYLNKINNSSIVAALILIRFSGMRFPLLEALR